jgi:AcrR family transcriptional regulator
MVSRSAMATNGVTDMRGHILDEASRLFLHYGFKKTTMDDIARRVGISKGALYLHFDSKEAIFFDIVDELRNTVFGLLTTIMATDLPPEEKIRRLHLDSLLFVWDHHHQAPHAPEVWGETAAMFSDRNEEFFVEGQRLLEQVIADGQTRGLFRDDVEPRRAAWVFAMASQGFAPPYARISDRGELERGIRDTVNLLLDGLSRSRR